MSTGTSVLCQILITVNLTVTWAHMGDRCDCFGIVTSAAGKYALLVVLDVCMRVHVLLGSVLMRVTVKNSNQDLG